MNLYLQAKSAPPSTANGGFQHPAFKQALDGNITLFTASPGYLLADSLAGEIIRQERPVLWLRLDKEDHDPATLLLSLIASARRLQPSFGSGMIDEMCQKPGPIYGWALLFSHLGDELNRGLPARTVVVLEHLDTLIEYPLIYQLLGGHFLPLISKRFTCLLLANKRIPRVLMLEHTRQQGMDDLRLDIQGSHILADEAHVSLPDAQMRRATTLTEGQAVALLGIYSSCNLLGRDFITRSMERARNMYDLLASIAREIIQGENPEALRLLSLVRHLDYSHPDLVAAILPHQTLQVRPWLQPLEGGWTRLRSIWSNPLLTALKTLRVGDEEDLRLAAGYLASQGALSHALRLYFHLDDLDSAAREISLHLSSLMDMGQWETLSSAIDRLPVAILEAWPRLIHARGEISAAQGNLKDAARDFAHAALLFSAGRNYVGACQSLLAESMVSVRLRDFEHGKATALSARGIATISGLELYRGWAFWQLATIAALTEDIDEALVYFNKAVKIINDPVLNEHYREVERLAIAQRDSRRLRELHQQAYQSAVQMERDSAERLDWILSSPAQDIEEYLKLYGWSHTPMFLKIPSQVASNPELDATSSLLVKFLHALGVAWHAAPDGVSASLTEHPLSERPFQEGPLSKSRLMDWSFSNLDSALQGKERLNPVQEAPLRLSFPIDEEAQPAIAPIGIADNAFLPPQAAAHPASGASVHGLALTVYLFGNFRLFVGELGLDKWPGGRSRSLCKYMLFHKTERLPREVLMETFWPEASPEASRNSLNVAMHELRQAFRTRTDTPVIEYQDGTYGINPDLEIWLDVEEFERHLLASQQLEAAGQLSLALDELEVATSLYQGDFMQDDPYEEWAVVDRTRLRITYLDLLDRLSNIYFQQGKYSACVSLSQRILECDNCREDAHRRLMRCYSRQGQHNLALRQFRYCQETLQRELDVLPEQDTIQLAERIRRREKV